MSAQHELPDHPLTPTRAPRQCGQDYCRNGHGVILVEYDDERHRLCRACRKDFWRTSS